ncbi:MAG: helix-hairpin-helix domain-containing protein [Candidatus Sericytochromatia bacterium]|nr:helix-hairpin-helix domain-containing protein [Candidatus Sericytochromatia bacterium]
MPAVLAFVLLTHILDTRVSVVLEAQGKPGRLVRIAPGARVADLLRGQRTSIPAGWLVVPPLATVLADGMTVRLMRPQLPRPAAPPRRPGRQRRTSSPPPAWPLDLNQADARDLDRLPGIGPGLARAILDRRRARGGRLRGPGDLLDLKGLGPRRLERIGPLVSYR